MNDSQHILQFSQDDSITSELSDFPESFFLARPEYSQAYLAGVARGYARMKKQNVVIAGLARNVGSVLPATIARIERLGNCFADFQVVIYENDSADNTLAQLRSWQNRNRNVHVISEQHNDPRHKQTRSLTRACRMAFYRDQCHEFVRLRLSESDCVILVDTDLEGGWSYDGVANTFGHDDWDFVGSYGVIFKRHRLSPNEILHYDAWAFREDEDFSPMTTHEVNHRLFERGAPLHAITSCFGGMGIYRMEAFLTGAYDGADTEHVGFHRRLRQCGYNRMFLNPSQITLYGRRHRSMDKHVRRFMNMLDKVTRKDPTPWYFGQLPADSQTATPQKTTKAA